MFDYGIWEDRAGVFGERTCSPYHLRKVLSPKTETRSTNIPRIVKILRASFAEVMISEIMTSEKEDHSILTNGEKCFHVFWKVF